MKTRWLCSYSDAKCAFIHIIPLRCSPLFYLQQRLRQIAKFLLKHEMKSKYKQNMPIRERETETHIISSLFVSVVRNYVVRANLISRRNKIETPKSQTKYIEPYVETICSQKKCSFYREGISLALSVPPGTFRITKQTKAPVCKKRE
jgi:hypothetical protein